MQLGKGAVETPFLASVHPLFDVFLGQCRNEADQAGNPRAVAVIATGASLRATRARSMSPTTAWLLRAVMAAVRRACPSGLIALCARADSASFRMGRPATNGAEGRHPRRRARREPDCRTTVPLPMALPKAPYRAATARKVRRKVGTKPDRRLETVHARLKLKVSLALRLHLPSATRELARVPQRSLRWPRSRLRPRGAVVKCVRAGRMCRTRRGDKPGRFADGHGMPSNSTPLVGKRVTNSKQRR